MINMSCPKCGRQGPATHIEQCIRCDEGKTTYSFNVLPYICGLIILTSLILSILKHI